MPRFALVPRAEGAGAGLSRGVQGGAPPRPSQSHRADFAFLEPKYDLAWAVHGVSFHVDDVLFLGGGNLTSKAPNLKSESLLPESGKSG